LPSIADLYCIGEQDTLHDAWLTTVNLLDVVERSQRVSAGVYDFDEARSKISKVLLAGETHKLDSNSGCVCGLSQAEHNLLRRKVLNFFRLEVDTLKHLLAS
jgi:hypothetical protein